MEESQQKATKSIKDIKEIQKVSCQRLWSLVPLRQLWDNCTNWFKFGTTWHASLANAEVSQFLTSFQSDLRSQAKDKKCNKKTAGLDYHHWHQSVPWLISKSPKINLQCVKASHYITTPGAARSQDRLRTLSRECHVILCLSTLSLQWRTICAPYAKHEHGELFLTVRARALNLCRKLISALWATYLRAGSGSLRCDECSIVIVYSVVWQCVVPKVTAGSPLNHAHADEYHSALMGHKEVPVKT